MKSDPSLSACLLKSSLLAIGTAACALALAGPALARIVTIDPPNSIATYAWSLNDKGEMTGFYFDGSDGTTKGFVRKPDGIITTFQHPTSKVTAAYGIDTRGRAAGYWSTDDGNFPGFVRTRKGTLKPFSVSEAVTGTFPVSMNANSSIAGEYYDTYDVPHGFLRTADGTIATFDVSGDTYGTFPTGINAGNSIAGHYGDSSGFNHGFLRTQDGAITAFDGARKASETFAMGINTAGTIAGYFQDSSGVTHGI